MKNITIYTDGACSGNPGPGGYAAILLCGDKEKIISGGELNTTNNRMELMGPISAFKALREPCSVTLYSDSSYVIKAFNEHWIDGWIKANFKTKDGERLNADLWRELLSVIEGHDVKWVQVKGHADNEYNNRCDEIAVSEWKRLTGAATTNVKCDTSLEVRDKFYDGELEEKVVSTKVGYAGRIFTVENHEVTLPNGTLSKRDVVVHNGGAAVVAVDDEGYTYLVRQYRIATKGVIEEIPAGKLEKGEDPKVAAIREISEEVGIEVKDAELLTDSFATPGYCSEKLYIYLVRCKGQNTHPHRDVDEFLEVVKIKFSDAIANCVAGKYHDLKTVAGLMLAKEKFGL